MCYVRRPDQRKCPHPVSWKMFKEGFMSHINAFLCQGPHQWHYRKGNSNRIMESTFPPRVGNLDIYLDTGWASCKKEDREERSMWSLSAWRSNVEQLQQEPQHDLPTEVLQHALRDCSSSRSATHGWIRQRQSQYPNGKERDAIGIWTRKA